MQALEKVWENLKANYNGADADINRVLYRFTTHRRHGEMPSLFDGNSKHRFVDVVKTKNTRSKKELLPSNLT